MRKRQKHLQICWFRLLMLVNTLFSVKKKNEIIIGLTVHRINFHHVFHDKSINIVHFVWNFLC